jgi:hypothetical protein
LKIAENFNQSTKDMANVIKPDQPRPSEISIVVQETKNCITEGKDESFSGTSAKKIKQELIEDGEIKFGRRKLHEKVLNPTCTMSTRKRKSEPEQRPAKCLTRQLTKSEK